ncbi:putative transposase [Pseudomonas sp. NFACC02]|uniref:Mu transposase C-terminal domain-containing protein n=1 Tax=Pseudomonas sp. NFACC02 TaxID=1566250 RepID=UPI0008D4D576|nr:Mu transposase C-terminal domain-containing protein [Pseudomonas sp. NFACC02]SEQ56218.1 putative transposase [Pseudomonas sp. NFACC02]
MGDDTKDVTTPYEPNRLDVPIEVGAVVAHGDSAYRISQVLDFRTVVGIDLESGRAAALPIGALKAVKRERVEGLYANYDMAVIGSEDWAEAKRRYQIIEPLLGSVVVGRAEVKARGVEFGVDTATVYRWLDRYKQWGELLALIPRKRGWKEGNSRISDAAGQIVEEVILNYYLQRHRPTVPKTIERIKEACEAQNITPPGNTAIRARLKGIPDKDYLRGRGFAEKARNKYNPTPGSFPGADYPLALVQIDHTPMDILLVDDVHRRSIGRVWITFAIDVYSRMITGYYLALDAPAGISVAMCVAHSILPKEEWLTAHGVNGEWPVWGKPKILHADNGADFQSEDVVKSCSNYGIENRFRPVKRPRYGAHIERLMGTFAQTLKDMPGRTYSKKEDRDGYDSEKHAALTFDEFETWLIREILIYNESYHSKIYMSPSRKWHIGIFGNADQDPLVGVPQRPTDPFTLQRDFLPAFERTVQHYGVQIDVFYYSEALRPWINAIDNVSGKARTFVFRRDPRDISFIWFFDPVLKQYFKVPVSNQSFPAASVWEFRAAKKRAIDEGHANINELLIKRYILENRELVAKSEAQTAKTRRQAQRHRVHAKGKTPAQPNPQLPKIAPAPVNDLANLIDGDLDDFGDIA